MKNITQYLTIGIVLISTCQSTTLLANGVNMQITEERAIEMANAEATSLGYDIKNMTVRVSKYDTPWNKYLPRESDSNYIVERKNKLKDKVYWVVYYSLKPKEPGSVIKGGGVGIFIDAISGDVITSIRDK